MKRVRLFISCPADVDEECRRARLVVERLQAEVSESLHLETVVSRPGVGPAAADEPEAAVAGDCDVYIAVVAGFLGNAAGLVDGVATSPATGSDVEAQFEAVVAGFRQRGKPDQLIYRKSLPPEETTSPGYARVETFFRQHFLSAEDNTATGAYHTCADPEQFEDLLTVHLRKLLRRYLPRPNNLPTHGSSFVGRRKLIAEVADLLRQSDTRLVSLIGPGGTGKSRLALRTAEEMLPDFEDGTYLVTLASLRQADLVPATIATTLDIRQSDNRPILDAVVDALKKKEMLLLIDNFEQVQSALKDLTTLITRCPRLKILLTGRETVRVSGARTVQVPPFALPDEKKATFEQIEASESVQLFVERARSVDPGFELTADNARQVLQICHRLDGLPLAIELATSRLRTMALEQLLSSMAARLDVLQGDDEELLDHQRSLRELISWSYELLTEEEQALWRRMAVFAGGFTMDAAEEVCDPDDEFVVDIEVEGLVDKSLANLRFHRVGGDEDARVSMLDTLREFALLKLAETGEAERFQQRFVDWVVELAEASFEELRSASSDTRIARLELEQVNLQAAIGRCTDDASADWNTALKIGGGVWFYWFERGMLSSSRQLFERALEDLPGVEDGVRALALRGLGTVARFQNDLDVAEKACLAALRVYTALGDRAGQGNALGELGAIAERKGDMAAAADFLDRALALFEEVPDDLHGISFASAARGVINHLDGDLAGARRFYERALSVGSESGDSDSIATSLVNLGEVAEAEGDFAQAYAYYTRCLELFANRGKKVAIAYCAEVIAGLSVKHRDKPSDAALLFGFAHALREEIESPIEPFNAQRLEADIEATRRAMFSEAFEASWNAGASLDIDEFLALIRDLEVSDSDRASA